VLPHTDLFYFDLKAFPEERHKKLTGASLPPIKDNALRLARTGADISFRMPVVPGLNDSPADLEGIANLIKSCGHDAIRLLPYHSGGESKIPRLRSGQQPLGLDISRAAMAVEEAARVFEELGVQAEKEGAATIYDDELLVGCFTVKMSEIVPVFSRRLTRFHGGLFNGQVVVVGGVDQEGRDATNDLTWIFLDAMDALRMRQPNYHARIHQGSPRPYLRRVAAMLRDGSAAPSLFNDEVTVPMLVERGVDRLGPTATLGSAASLDQGRLAKNGLNLKLDRGALKGDKGVGVVEGLMHGYFQQGGMQAQFNILDPEILRQARDHPDQHPWLLVRVSGYSAYFNDLSPEMKQEIIDRSIHSPS